MAVVDTGAKLDHEDLLDNLWTNPGEIANNGVDDDGNGYVDDVHGIDATVHSGNPTDQVGHGTHVAGVIGARGNNGKGICGVAWQVKLMILKASAADEVPSDSVIIECLEYAKNKGAHIVNASFGGNQYGRQPRRAWLRHQIHLE